MVKKSLSLIFLALFILAGCRKAETWQTTTFLFFDTVCEIKISCTPNVFKLAKKEVQQQLEDVENLFAPGKKKYSSPLVIKLFQQARKLFDDSSGFFDVTVASLSSLYGFHDKKYRIPSQDEISAALKRIGMHKILIKPTGLIIPPEIELDWGGIAKGLGLDLSVARLQSLRIKNGFINAGGDLRCWGKNPDGLPWKIGIRHPRKSGYLGVLFISDLAIATSGDYQRFFIKEGIRYHHIFNPKTGYPSRGKQSVTVIGPEAAVCDGLSTALFVSPNPDEIINKYPSYGAILVSEKGEVSRVGKSYPFRGR